MCATALGLLSGAAGLVLVLAAALGRRQQREAGGTRAQWLAAAAVATAMVLLPGAVALGLRCWRPELLAGWGALLATLYLVLLGAAQVLPSMLPPVQLLGNKHALPEVTDRATLDRIAQLAAQLGIAPPRTRFVGSTRGGRKTRAWAGGLPCPSLVVAEETLLRLRPAERDGVLAQELAHIANGSLWLLAALGPLCSAVGVALIAVTSPIVAVGAALVLFQLVRAVTGRRVEIACDLRAAEAVGFAPLDRALDLIQSSSDVPDGGLLGTCFYALGKQPPLSVRRWALWRGAPWAARAAIRADPWEARRQSASHGAALAAQIAILLTAVALGRQGIRSTIVAGALLGGLLLLPWVLKLVATGPGLLLRRRRLGAARNLPGSGLAIGGVAVAWAGSALFVTEYSPIIGLTALGLGLLGLLLGTSRMVRAQELRVAIVQCLVRKRPGDAIRLAESRRDAVARDPAACHDVALARLLAGDTDRGTAALEALGPSMPRAQLTLAVALLTTEPAAACALADGLRQRLPADPVPLLIQARALRRLGRLDEALPIVEGLRTVLPGDGGVLATAASVAIGRGDLETAARLLADARRFEPGAAYVRFVEAELAVASRSATAGAALERARAAARADPFAFLEGAVAALESAARGYDPEASDPSEPPDAPLA